MRFESAGHLLRQFSRATGSSKIGELTPEEVADFLRGKGALSATWALKYKVLTGLYRFAISRGYVGCSPLPRTLPKLPPQQTPYVYSTEELRRLLEATTILRIGHSPQVPAMYRTLLLLLYGSGMRIGEALHLTLQDVDLTEQVITIRDTKFFKTRLVPIGPKLTRELADHIERRHQLPMRGGIASPLFTTRDGRAWSYPRV
ncbi:MAG: tyrosine-type recombinase/integrase, partial [Bryobacteraceae bacterium]